jgi:hypothetical protein
MSHPWLGSSDSHPLFSIDRRRFHPLFPDSLWRYNSQTNTSWSRPSGLELISRYIVIKPTLPFQIHLPLQLTRKALLHSPDIQQPSLCFPLPVLPIYSCLNVYPMLRPDSNVGMVSQSPSKISRRYYDLWENHLLITFSETLQSIGCPPTIPS